jgi:hypothetical protein
MALRVGQSCLAEYNHRFSPKTFTQPQLLACLVLKAFFRTDYRGIVAILADMPSICQAIGLRRVPHFTTLQKACRRFMASAVVEALLNTTVEHVLGDKPEIELAAVDSSGFELQHVSPYFVRRRSRQPGLWQTTRYKKYGKLGIVCDCATHLILSTLRNRGPTPDINQLRPTVRTIRGSTQIQTILADAGYDSQANHEYLREVLGIETIIPPKHGRPTKRPPKGKWRRLMSEQFDRARYGQRWQVETVFSMIKRNLGSSLRGRCYWSQCRDLALLAVTHNVMIAMHVELFYRAGQEPFLILPALFDDLPACSAKATQPAGAVVLEVVAVPRLPRPASGIRASLVPGSSCGVLPAAGRLRGAGGIGEAKVWMCPSDHGRPLGLGKRRLDA